MEFPKLYKRTSAGKIQEWQVKVEGDSYWTISGQSDGKKRTSKKTVCKAKNVGKANEVTPEEQAVLKAKSMVTKQKKKGYHEDVDNIDEESFFKPMLAVKWEDRKDKIEDNRVFIQPKLDGIRCVVSKDGMFTRNGEWILTSKHIHSELQLFFDLYPEAVIDGELYNHKFKKDFNKISSLVKKTKNIDDEVRAETKRLVEYHVYDVYMEDLGGYRDRYEFLQRTIGQAIVEMTKLVETRYIKIDEVDDHADQFIADGYEGAMVRLVDSPYEKKRSRNLIKWKEMQDAEFEIVDILEGQGNKSGMAASTVHKLEDGRTFSAGIIGNEDYCRDLLRDKDEHIGKPGTVVFQNYTPDGIPRFGKFKAVRDYE